MRQPASAHLAPHLALRAGRAAAAALLLASAAVAARGAAPAEEAAATPPPSATAAPSPAAAATASPGGPPAPAGGSVVAPVRPRRVTVLDRGAIELSGAAQRPSRWKGAPISLSLRDAPLPEVLRSFARLTGVNLVLDPRVQGEVTVELADVPWDQALFVILRAHGMAAEIDGDVWLVAPR